MLKPIPIPTTKTDETDRIVYHDTTIDGRRCIVKRNKSHSEFAIDPNTHEVVAFANLPNCIRNEKAAMDFVRANTCIPVPEVLFYLDEGDRVLLGVEVVEGIKMDEIQDERDRAKVIEQLDGFVEQLAQHRSPKIKGFAAKACFSLALTDNLPRCSLKFVEDHDQGYPLCHGDLHQSNIIVDPETKKAKAVLDWEYCGYYPDECEPRRYKAGVKDVVCPDGSIVKYRKWGEKAFEALKKYTVDSDDDEWLARRADRHLSWVPAEWSPSALALLSPRCLVHCARKLKKAHPPRSPSLSFLQLKVLSLKQPACGRLRLCKVNAIRSTNE